MVNMIVEWTFIGVESILLFMLLYLFYFENCGFNVNI
jgi:hypothetical protein